MNALGTILGSQGDFGYGPCGVRSGDGGATQGVGNRYDPSGTAEGGEDDALSEWIHDDEWETL